jgi:hypothetical protein
MVALMGGRGVALVFNVAGASEVHKKVTEERILRPRPCESL